MESEYPESWSRHTPKGMNIVSQTTKSKKCCDTCKCGQAEEEKFNKLMETQVKSLSKNNKFTTCGKIKI